MLRGWDDAEISNDEGFMGILDFNSLVLPRDNQYLRA